MQECNISKAVWLIFPRRLAMPPVAAAIGAWLLIVALRPPVLTLAGMLLRGTRAVAAVGRRNRHADQPLDVAQIRRLLVIAERDRHAVAAGARGAADAVDVRLRNVRQVGRASCRERVFITV